MDMNLVLHCYKLWCPSQGSVLGPLLLLLYINDLNQAIKSCKVHPFADVLIYYLSVSQSKN